MNSLYFQAGYLDQKEGASRTAIPHQAIGHEMELWLAGWDWAAAGETLDGWLPREDPGGNTKQRRFS
jgi:hypothetical protein